MSSKPHVTKHEYHASSKNNKKHNDHFNLTDFVQKRSDLEKEIELQFRWQTVVSIRLAAGAFFASVVMFTIINFNVDIFANKPEWVVLTRVVMYALTLPLFLAMNDLGSHDLLLILTTFTTGSIMNIGKPSKMWNMFINTAVTAWRFAIVYGVWLGGGAVIQYFQLASVLGEPLVASQAQLNYGRTFSWLIVFCITAYKIWCFIFVHLTEDAYEVVCAQTKDASGNVLHENTMGYHGPPPIEAGENEPNYRAERRVFANKPAYERLHHNYQLWMKGWSSLLDKPVENLSEDHQKWQKRLYMITLLDFLVNVLNTGSPLLLEQLFTAATLNHGFNSEIKFYCGARLLALVIVPIVALHAHYIDGFRVFIQLPYILTKEPMYANSSISNNDSDSDGEDEE
jgi:large-conductance mechanosensitive channel